MTAQRDDACDGTDAGLGCVCGQPDNHRAAGQDYPMLRAVATSPIYPLVSCYSEAGKRLHHEAKSFLSALAARDEENERLQETLSTLGVEFVEDAGPQAFWRNTRAENAEYKLRLAEAEQRTMKERLARLQDTHREEHLRAEQAEAERDALKQRVAELERERDEAREKLRRVADFLERAGHPPDAHFVKMASDVVKFRE